MDAYERQAALVRAMAHPTRLHILEILSTGEWCVCHLTAVLGQRQPSVSQHLMVLRESGLVLDRRDGAMVFYRLADSGIREWVAQTKRLLRSEGDADYPPVPAAPVRGCNCPGCQNKDTLGGGKHVGS